MAAATDRDLLSLEPSLLRDVSFAAQRLVAASDVHISGTTLLAAQVDFESAGVKPGHVAVVSDLPVEIVEVLTAQTLTVSLLRATLADEPIAPGDQTGVSMSISTFAPQIAIIHTQLLQALGIGPAGSGAEISEEAILNPGELRLLEAYGALELIFSAAANPTHQTDPLWVKARMYHQRFTAQRPRLVLHLDVDGDGLADATRRAGVLRLTRG